jgi:hypothetical protein
MGTETTTPRRHALPPGHQLITAVKATTGLAPGDKVHIAGLGAFAVSAHPIPVPRTRAGDLVCVPLGWERLALLAARHAAWDAISIDPPIWRHRPCRTCGGSGRQP